MAAKALDRRGVRRMLVTTLGRIERIEDWLKWAELPPEQKPGLLADLAKQQEKLRQYNALARDLMKGA